MAVTRELPEWAEEIRSTYLRGESSVFVLHGNVFDLILHNGDLIPLTDFLANHLFAKKDIVCHFNPSLGVKFRKKDKKVDNIEDFVGPREIDVSLAGLEKLLRAQNNVAVIIDYADMVAPSGQTSFLTEADRRTVVTLHRWSLDRAFEDADNVVVLVTEQLPDLSSKIVSNPKIAAIEVPLPDQAERLAIVRLLEPEASDRDIEKLASLSAGLKTIQVRGLLAPGEDSEEDYHERYEKIRELVGDAPDAKERAKKLTRVTSGMTGEQVRAYLTNEGFDLTRYEKTDGRYEEVFRLMGKRKREIIEKECFGLIEFVDSDHDFSAVGGMDQVKRELMQIAHNIREGASRRVPMGLLFTGPMGTGKTFVAEAFAKSSGLTAIKLKNFRSKWVGSTEGNLEKILSVVKALGNILVIIDEGDRAFGNTSSGDGDGGTSSRVIARIKEFMSDTSNRGRVLFVLMTNRPDKLDIDIKRAGRLDRKIPFFSGQEPEDVEPVILAQLRRHKIAHEIEFPRDRPSVSARLVGYSNADLEAVALESNNLAEAAGSRVTPEHFGRAIDDYLPSRDAKMLEYMELLAVFETSSRALLPRRYREMPVDALFARLADLRALVG
ncbi:MAG: AAA family ATPase [Deltaproteobacteria bacterium]|nr:AAA family ATPase [Deltaproteobacteria bacterium]